MTHTIKGIITVYNNVESFFFVRKMGNGCGAKHETNGDAQYKAKTKFVQFNGLEKSTFGMISFYYPT